MKFQKSNGDRLVIGGAIRTPFGQSGKSLSKFQSIELSSKLAEQIFKKENIKKENIDGVIVGEIFQSSKAPNAARVLSVKLGLPIDSTAACISNNCVSGYEAISEAARRILLEENEIILVVGQESMSNMPVYFNHASWNSKTANSAKIIQNWDSIKEEVEIIDSVEEGLTDPVRNANMAETGEVVAQKLGLSKEELDEYAHSSYSKTYNALINGDYDPYLLPIQHEKGVLDKDEYIMSKVGLIRKPERFARVSPIFDMPPHTSLKKFYAKYGSWIGKEYDENTSKATISLFNACPRSDGAGALILTTESKAKSLGLNIHAFIKAWANAGIDPIYMGLGMAHSMQKALNVSGLSWDDMDFFEIHEAFASTAYGSIKFISEEMGYDLLSRYKEGDINRNGGTLAIGHPLGATGIRVAINQILGFQQDKDSKYSMGTICAGGGVGGAFILERAT